MLKKNQFHDRVKSTGSFDIIIILIMMFASVVFTHKYVYGVSDHAIIIPFIKSLVNPALYPNDYLIMERSNFPMNFFGLYVFLIKYYHFSLQSLFFMSYLISIFFIFLSVFLLSMTIFEKKEVAVLSLVMLVFLPISTLAAVPIYDKIFLMRTAAYPMFLFSLYFFLNKKFDLSFAFQAAGLFVHPLSAFYMQAILCVLTVLHIKEIGLKKVLTYAFLLAAAWLCWVMFAASSSYHILNPSVGLFRADQKWVDLLKLRLQHHTFPFYRQNEFFTEAFFFLIFLISWKCKPKEEFHRAAKVITGIVALFFICGAVFTTLIPLTIVINLELYRSSVFLGYLMIIYFANYLFNSLVSKRLIDRLWILCLLMLLVFNDRSFVLLLFLSGAIFIYGSMEIKKPLTQKILIGVMICFAFFFGMMRAAPSETFFSIDNAQPKQWLDMQKWARDNTDIADTFIVSTEMTGFRVESERTIYGDWKDGGQLFFNPSFGYKWLKRMKKLGFAMGRPLELGFALLREQDFVNIANKAVIPGHHVFLITHTENMPMRLPIYYKNRKFVAYLVK